MATATKRTCDSTGTLTGRTVTHYGITLPEATGAIGAHSTCEVDVVAYYVHDVGGVLAGSRQCWGEDYGGNDAGNGVRTAPGSTLGVVAQERGRPLRVTYSEPEVFFND